MPGVRVAKLGTLSASKDAGNLLDQDVLYDILRVEVTKLNTGISTYSITFNNWYLSTATDRAAASDSFRALGNREAEAMGRPSFPRFN
jgi:hypothetical protein